MSEEESVQLSLSNSVVFIKKVWVVLEGSGRNLTAFSSKEEAVTASQTIGGYYKQVDSLCFQQDSLEKVLVLSSVTSLSLDVVYPDIDTLRVSGLEKLTAAEKTALGL